MAKLSEETKAMIRKIANRMPLFDEGFDELKHIHQKDIETKGLKKPKDFDKNKQYQATHKGQRLITSDVHYKRMCKAYKKHGSEGYRSYLLNYDKKEFRELTTWEKIKNYLGL